MICENGQPNLDANAASSADFVFRTLRGACTDTEKLPGFTAASTVCQVRTSNGVPPTSCSRLAGCWERLLSVKSLLLSVGGPFSEVTIPGRIPTSISTGTL